MSCLLPQKTRHEQRLSGRRPTALAQTVMAQQKCDTFEAYISDLSHISVASAWLYVLCVAHVYLHVLEHGGAICIFSVSGHLQLSHRHVAFSAKVSLWFVFNYREDSAILPNFALQVFSSSSFLILVI